MQRFIQRMRRKREYLFALLLLTLFLNSCTFATPTGDQPALPASLEKRPMPPINERVLVPTPRPKRAGQQPAPPIALDKEPLTAAQAELLASLPNQGPAPELQNDIWFNSEPLRLADLRGNVVIVEFWTYG